jgi:hypothetical protein
MVPGNPERNEKVAITIPKQLGPWKPKLTKIYNMWTQPCDVNPIIWMTAYFAASPVIAYSVLTPDCLDIAGERMRVGHRKQRKGSIRMADYANPINVPGQGYMQVAFKFYSAAQRIGWYLTIIDATLEWVVVGTSLAYQWTGCQDPESPRATLDMQNAVLFLLPASTFFINTWRIVSYAHLSPGPGGIPVPKGYAVSCGFTLTQIQNAYPGLPDANWQARIVDVIGENTTPWQTPGAWKDGARGVTFYQPVTGELERNHLYRVQVQKTFGVLVASGDFVAAGDDLKGISKSACGKSIPGV